MISRRRGFSLIEVLISVTILTMVMAMVWGSFYNITQASRKGQVLIDQINQTDFVVDQLLDSLNATAFLQTNPKDFEFWHEDDEAEHPADMISWVTSSSAFMPPRSDLAHGLHRIVLTIEEDEDGERGLAVAAWPHLQDPEDEDFEEVEPWIVSRRVKGLDCKIYNSTLKEWEDEWEKKNTIPQFLMLTLTIDPLSESGEIYERTVSVQIPVGTIARGRGRFTPVQPGSNDPAEQPQGATPGMNPAPGVGTPPNRNNGRGSNPGQGNNFGRGGSNNGGNSGRGSSGFGRGGSDRGGGGASRGGPGGFTPGGRQ